MSFKDGKIKYEPIFLAFEKSKYDWFEMPLNDGSLYHKKNGEPYKMNIRLFNDCVYTVELLKLMLENYLNSDTNPKSQDW